MYHVTTSGPPHVYECTCIVCTSITYSIQYTISHMHPQTYLCFHMYIRASVFICYASLHVLTHQLTPSPGADPGGGFCMLKFCTCILRCLLFYSETSSTCIIHVLHSVFCILIACTRCVSSVMEIVTSSQDK